MRSITIDNEVLSVTKAIEKARGLLKTQRIIDKNDIDYNFVLWIFQQRRPLAVIDDSLIFRVSLGGDNKYNCFWSKQGDSDWDAFSYKKALEPYAQKIENIEGSIYSKGDYLKAFRNVVYDQIKSFRDKELKKNKVYAALAKEDPYNIHTDHVVPMHLLISDFLNDRGMKLGDVQLCKIRLFNTDQYWLKDESLRIEWEAYHRTNAKLKLVTKEENLSKAGSHDVPLYNYKKKRAETYD